MAEIIRDVIKDELSIKRKLSPIYVDEIRNEDSVQKIERQDRKRIAFGWYGGKFSHLSWLLPLLPQSTHYVEPYSGSAAVLLNRPPSSVETYNDIDGEVCTFFRVLRDRPEELIYALSMTPFSREEFYLAVEGPARGIPDLERARRFFIRARQTRTGLAQTATLGRWANCKNTSRSGMSGVVSRWLGGIDGLQDIAQRLMRVQIENRPAIDVINLYDGPHTLFYCDPPYLHETRSDAKAYGFEMDNAQHADLARVLQNIEGRAAVSGYRCDQMDEWYAEWKRFDAPVKQCHSSKADRQECVWMNY
jgi:DNA adenine methylase